MKKRTRSILFLLFLAGAVLLSLCGCATAPFRGSPASVPGHGDARAMFHYSIAIQYMLDGKMDEAIAELETARRFDEQSVELTIELAVLYAEKGNPEKVIATLQDATRRHPREPMIISFSGEPRPPGRRRTRPSALSGRFWSWTGIMRRPGCIWRPFIRNRGGMKRPWPVMTVSSKFIRTMRRLSTTGQGFSRS